MLLSRQASSGVPSCTKDRRVVVVYRFVPVRRYRLVCFVPVFFRVSLFVCFFFLSFFFKSKSTCSPLILSKSLLGRCAMERHDRYSDHYCFFFCSACDSTSVDSGAFYICLSCTSRSPFIYICEKCYLDDRRGLHRDCDEFDATFPKPTPASWLALPTPELDKSLAPSLPKQFLVRCVARASGTKEATLGHCFVVGDCLYR